MKCSLRHKSVLSLLVFLVILFQPLVLLSSPLLSYKFLQAEQATVLSWVSENETALKLSLIPFKKLKYLQFSGSQVFEHYNTRNAREMKQARAYPILSPGLHFPFIVYKISPTQYTADG